MRVALLIAAFHPAVGGAERQALLMAKHLVARHGVDITVFTRGRRGSPARESFEGLTIIRTPLADRARWMASAAYLGAGLPFLALRPRRFDVYHCVQSYSPATLGALAATARGGRLLVKVTASNQLGEAQELRRLPFFAARMRLLRRVDAFVALTDEVERELLELGIAADRIVQIPNGVAIPEAATAETVAAARAACGLPRDRAVVAYTGRLSSEKNLDVLVEALARIARHPSRPLLLLVGPGSHVRDVEAELRRRVAELGLDDSVRFVGEVADVSPHLHAADVFVLPSRSEGLSNALLEAMAHGKAVVVTSIPGNRIVEAGVDGLKAPVGDADALGDAIRTLLDDAALRTRLGAAARDKAIRDFSIESVARRYLALYRGQ